MSLPRKLWSGINGLVVGGRDSLSLGRVAFWLCFILALVKWHEGKEITQSHESTLAWILAYCLGGKVVNKWKDQGRESVLETPGEGGERR